MKKILLLCAVIGISAAALTAGARGSAPGIGEPESISGITHYGMPIQEMKKTYRKQDAVLEVIYSKMLSDDNMDDYVKRFYDEFLHQIETWLYEKPLPAPNMKIVISNCKFCKVGYCKKKNVTELRLVSYKNDKKDKEIAVTHRDIIDRSKYENLSRRAAILFLGK
ncbi:MAG: hypothetical protein A2W19_03305 [Spirochaetes bacterium RBG_16_49_21]|nr:MAG: hypothetical protein A2W19_03305 [Spirochaetes bacterium RBG_16_49_21]